MTRFAATCGIALTLAASHAAAQDYRYAMFDIPINPESFGTSAPEDVNQDGLFAAGTWRTLEHPSAMTWHNGVMQEMGQGGASAINANGDVAGNNWDNPPRMATLWKANGEVVFLGTLGGQFSAAVGMNDLGQVVGGADLLDNSDGGHAFLWNNGVMTDLGTLVPGHGSSATDINNHSQVVGKAGIANNTTMAFFWENGQMTQLPSLADRVTVAYAINDAGVIVGVSLVSGTFDDHRAVKWIDGQIINIHDNVAALESDALAINDRGDIAGNMWSRSENRGVGFLLQSGDFHMLNLNDYIPPRTGYVVRWVHCINDFGQIGVRDYERDTGLILSPVTPTLALDDPAPGQAGRMNRLTITGATPGERLYFVYGLRGGGTVIPGCDLQTGAAAQIDDPVIIGTAVANSNGEANITRFVPNSAAGHDILIQAIQKDGCKVSQLVMHRFE